MAERNVCTEVVANQMCVGCGICAGVCPEACLQMRTTEYGEYVPDLCGTCTACELCLDVCPFCDNAMTEDTIGRQRFGHVPGIQHTSATGYHLECYAGNVSSEERRLRRSTGGLASWFLAELLNRGIVDCVACVVQNADPEKLFRFALLDTPEKIWGASTSCYYPVEMSDILRTVRRDGRRFAFVGLPCFLKGLCRAMAADAALAERIVALAGLVCSHLKSKFFAEYSIRLAGADPREVTHVDFRKKLAGRPLDDYRFLCRTGSGDAKVEHVVENDPLDWKLERFKINACNYCDDIFAEAADAVFMDAWLAEYMKRHGGTGLVVARSPLARTLFDQAFESDELQLERVGVAKVIRSQANKLETKRRLLVVRLAVARRKGRWVPAKRLGPRLGRNPLKWFQVSAALRRIAASRIAFADQRRAGPGLATYRRELSRLTLWDRLIEPLVLTAQRLARCVKRALRRAW